MVDTEATARATFPARKIGKLQDGYEANFLVLDRDPSAKLDKIGSVSLRIKDGRQLFVPAPASFASQRGLHARSTLKILGIS